MNKVVLKTNNKRQVIDITDEVEGVLDNERATDGLCNLIVLHTTCALTVADLDAGTDKDYLDAFAEIVPKLKYRHPHDPNHVGDHIMSALIGVSVTLPYQNGKLDLGTWQRVILVEFNGPRERKISVSLIPKVR